MPKIWLAKFSQTYDYLVNKNNFSCNDKTYNAGDDFDKTDVTIRRLRQLYESRKIIVKEPNIDLTTDEQSDTIIPEIRKVGTAWMGVFVGEKQIGKSVRTQEEAQVILDHYIAHEEIEEASSDDDTGDE